MKDRREVKWIKTAASCFLFVMLLCPLSGCGEKEEEKIVINILYTNMFENLERLVEDTYPDIDLQCERMTYYNEQVRRLEKGVGPDLVVLPQPSQEIARGHLLDIGDTRASTSYDGTVMQQLQVDGFTYLLPLPGQYRGYIVNETLFEQAGVPLPTTNQELLDALVSLKNQGIGVGEDDTNFSIYSDYNTELGMYYIGYMVPDFLGTMNGVRWLAGFRRFEDTFAETWQSVFHLTNRMAEAGVLDTAAIGGQRNSILYQKRMAEGTMAVVFGSSSIYQGCVEENQSRVLAGTGSEYSYRMLPLMSDKENSPWIILSPSAYIGLNAEADERTQEAGKRILELISTPEGQAAVVEDLQMGFSYLRDYQPDSVFAPNGLDGYIQSGYVYNVQFPDKTVEYLGSLAKQVLAGKLTVQDMLSSVDQYHIEGAESVDYALSVVGVVESDLLFEDYNVRKRETEIGNLLADSVAMSSGAPIAVVNGGGIRGSLYQGEVYGEDLAAICPYDNVVVVLEMKGQTLWEMLENSLAVVNDKIPGGRFLQVSGISYTFDSSKPAGERLAGVKLADGSPLELTKTYQVAVNDYMAGKRGYAEGNGDGYRMLNCYDDKTPKGEVTLIRETQLTYRDALAHYFEQFENSLINVKLEGRITDLKYGK